MLYLRKANFRRIKSDAYGEEHADLFAEHNLLMLTFNSQEDANKTAQALKGEITFEDAVITNSTKAGTDSNGKLLSPYRTTVNRTFPNQRILIPYSSSVPMR